MAANERGGGGDGKASRRKRRRRMPSARRRVARRRKPSPPENTLQIIDRLLLERIKITINGKPTRVTVLAAIVFQLLKKELAGDRRAARVLLRYQELARRSVDKQVQLEFADSDNARFLAEHPPENPHE